jgi:hypothetical protein
VRVWDLGRGRAVRRHLRPIRLRHTAPVLAAVLILRGDHVRVVTGCQDSISRTWDLPAGRMLSTTLVPGGSAVSAITTLGHNHVLHASGAALSLYQAANAASPILTIELDSEIQALTAHGTTTAVAATRLGVVVLEIPHTGPGNTPAPPARRPEPLTSRHG